MDILNALDLAGTLVFAVSGGLKAIKYELDLLGIIVLAILTGVGGGILRDVLLGATPPAVFEDEKYLFACILGGILAFLMASRIEPRWREMLVADAIGLGVFAAIGAAKAQAFGLGLIGVVMMAGLTATGGGVLRDVLVRETPAVLQRDFYASAALAGGVSFWILTHFNLPLLWSLIIVSVVTTGLRFLAIWKRMHLPKARR